MIVRPERRLAAPARGGFTLLEVLVVVAILVILASVASFATFRYLGEAKRKQAIFQMQKIETASKTYQINNGSWPTAVEELIEQSNGLPPLLEGGPSAITDPWNNRFVLNPGVDAYGSPRMFVISQGDGSGGQMQWPDR